ncbi:MAG: thioredoxin domain-containing protein [Spirulinaceae cyanobacterium SM2_1_0]|nr:thioredoxin domain-containing protein [Spirulinaceae cyanobacterium SM2_1_0]
MTNRLAETQSLYLRKHAENPIDWWPWCDEALATAAAEDKPIFLSIGYSSCHWCTVMEGEAFSDGAIADYMNAHYLPIKVDREERPDIDSIYMQALQMMAGQGGWPLNIFLTPDQRIPFYGGTYFPVEPRFNRPGFLQVLQRVREFYDREKDKLQEVQTQMLDALQRSTLLPAGDRASFTAELRQQGIGIASQILRQSEPGRPSFPMIPYANLVLAGSRWSESAALGAIAQQRGDDLALGGIYDQVAGGFHRYTVDATWTVPHFEKMLYDNGQILTYLADLWSSGLTEPAYERAVLGTVDWLQREMTAPEGYFYAAQDADSFATAADVEPEEGAFHVWRYDELTEILSAAELQALQAEFTVTPTGNFEGSNVLQRSPGSSLSATAAQALDKLFERRYGGSRAAIATFPPARNNQEAKSGNWSGRIPAVTDTKMIVAWNSLTISGLARVATVFDSSLAWRLAVGAARFILEQQWQGDRLHRLNYEGNVSVLAQSEDYAFFIRALLDLHQASLTPATKQNTPDWLAAAVRVQAEFDQFLWSVELGGYYNAPTDASDDLLVRERSYIDNATPAANGIAAANLVRLALLTDRPDDLARAEQVLQAFSLVMEQSPQACPSLVAALDWYQQATLVRTTGDRLAELTRQYWPRCMFRLEPVLPEDAVGLVCQGLTCLPPLGDRDALRAQISRCQNEPRRRLAT